MSTELPTNPAEPAENGKKKRTVRTKRAYMAGQYTDMAEFAAQSRAWVKVFKDNVADFTAFDPKLDSAFAANWLNIINQLTAHPSDEVMVDMISEQTQKLEKVVERTLHQASDLEYFVRKAFPDDERKQDEFGFRQLVSVSSNSNLKFTLYAHTMHRVALSYEADLLAADMPASLLTDFEISCGQCGDLEIEQEFAKRQRIKATTQRIKLANQLHACWERVNKAAKIIYRTKPETAKIWERG